MTPEQTAVVAVVGAAVIAGAVAGTAAYYKGYANGYVDRGSSEISGEFKEIISKDLKELLSEAEK